MPFLPYSVHTVYEALRSFFTVYVELHAKYFQKILFDFETRATVKLFRVVSIQFVRSYTSSRLSCWEATCEPVYRDSMSGTFHVPAEMQVPGSHVTLTHALVGYCVAEYGAGLDADPTYLPWVDNYINHFTNSILPKYTIENLFALLEGLVIPHGLASQTPHPPTPSIKFQRYGWS